MKKNFQQLGGRYILEKMTKVFYDKVYADPWIGQYFQNIEQKIIESQQVDFLQGSLGGEKVYCGRLPVPAHKHMFIPEELYTLRSQLLHESLIEVGACEELIERIEKIDDAFKASLVKKDISECEKRYFTDEVLAFSDPKKQAA